MNDTALDKLNKAHKKGVILGLADFGVAQRVCAYTNMPRIANPVSSSSQRRQTIL